MAKPKVYRGYSNSRGDRNQASTSGQTYYDGDPSKTPKKAFHGRRMMTTKGQKVQYNSDKPYVDKNGNTKEYVRGEKKGQTYTRGDMGMGKQYGDQVLVTRQQQQRAIKTAIRNAEKESQTDKYARRLMERNGMSENDAYKRARSVVNRAYSHTLLAG